MQFLLVQNRQQTHDLTLIGSGANGLGILEWVYTNNYFLLVKNRQQTRDLTLIGSGANGLGILEWV